METFIPERADSEFKPTVITLAIDSIRSIKARKVAMLNHTVTRLTNRLNELKNKTVDVETTKTPVSVMA